MAKQCALSLITAMPNDSKSFGRGNLLLIRWVLSLVLVASAGSVRAQAITNLQQLTQTMNTLQRVSREVRLDLTVCAASRPKVERNDCAKSCVLKACAD